MRYTLRHRGHLLEVRSARGEKGTTYRLVVDGEQIAEQEAVWRDPKFVLGDLETGLDLDELGLTGAKIVATSWRRGRISTCNLVLPAKALGTDLGDRPERIPFEPPPGTRAHRTWKLKQDRPGLYAARHLVVGVGEVVVALLGIRLVIHLIPWPDIGLPDLDLPDLNLPNLDLPGIPWPDVDLPGLPDWVKAVLGAKQYWLPIVIALFVTAGELERRKRRTVKEAEAAERLATNKHKPDGVAAGKENVEKFAAGKGNTDDEDG